MQLKKQISNLGPKSWI